MNGLFSLNSYVIALFKLVPSGIKEMVIVNWRD